MAIDEEFTVLPLLLMEPVDSLFINLQSMVLELVPRNQRLRTVRQATLYVRHCPVQLAPTKSETGTVLQATVRQTLLTFILSAILD